MTAPAPVQRSRLQVAAEAFEALERERYAPPPDVEACRGQLPDDFVDQLRRVAGMPRLRPLSEQMEYLRVWCVFIAAREHPLLEALSSFGVQRPSLPRDCWEIRCDTVFPGHRYPGDNLRWISTWALDPTVMMIRGDWTDYARVDLAEWLKVQERNLANALRPVPG